jgi:hypothetical protein
MGSLTDNLSLYLPDVENDDTMGDFFPGLVGNFEKLDDEVGTLNKNTKALAFFDFLHTTPRLFNHLRPLESTVMQSFAIDELNRHIYVVQLNSRFTSGGAEDVTITRCSFDGRRIDYMLCENMGHGTQIGVENTNGTLYIWSSYEIVDASGTATDQEIVRFPYKAGGTINQSDASIQRFSALPKGDNLHPAVDQKNRQMVIRYDNKTDRQWVELHDLDAVLANQYNPLATVDIPADISYLQSFWLDDGALYWYTGDTNEDNYPRLITVINMETGEQIAQKGVSVGSDIAQRYEGDIEPEGMCMFTDPDTGAKTLLIGIVTGVAGARIRRIYAYHSYQSFQRHVPMIPYPLLMNEGYNTSPNVTYMPRMIPFILEFDGTNWGPCTSGYMPSIFSNIVESVVIETTGDMTVSLSERYIGLIGVTVQEDDKLMAEGYQVTHNFYAGGGDSHKFTLKFWRDKTKFAPTAANSIRTASRLGVMLYVMTKAEK